MPHARGRAGHAPFGDVGAARPAAKHIRLSELFCANIYRDERLIASRGEHVLARGLHCPGRQLATKSLARPEWHTAHKPGPRGGAGEENQNAMKQETESWLNLERFVSFDTIMNRKVLKMPPRGVWVRGIGAAKLPP